ncbi:MAG TPA: hypothetical protein VMS56_04265 [Thermoanaerobaculia bacterium]|nr:hypothetical protein [Thermoanaerobaculia bacterium]
MSIERIVFAGGPSTRPELVLAARAVAEALAARGAAAVVTDDGWPDALDPAAAVISLCEREAVATPPTWHLAITGSELEMRRGAEPCGRAPLAIAVPVERPFRRVLVAGTGTPGRLLRMIGRTAAALRARRAGVTIAFWGEIPEELHRDHLLGEVHPDPDADELARLLATAGCILDPADEPEERNVIASLGPAAGIPTVVFGRGGPGMLAVGEWSGEALAEGVLEALGRPRGKARGGEEAAELVAKAVGLAA